MQISVFHLAIPALGAMAKVVRVFFLLFEVLVLVESHQADIVLLVVVLPVFVGVQDLLHVHYYLFYLTRKESMTEVLEMT